MCDARRVLVVEDQPALRALAEVALAEAGYHVTTASNGEEALARVPTADPCVILLDLRMPVMDGWAFARAYRERHDRQAHMIVMTAERNLGDLASLAPAAVVGKPFDLDQLLATVAHWTARHVPPGQVPRPAVH